MIQKVEEVQYLILYYAYVKSQMEINKLFIKPEIIRPIDWFEGYTDKEFVDSWDVFKREIAHQLIQCIGSLKFDGDFRDFLDQFDEAITDEGDITCSVFNMIYFTNLYENLHWFTESERKDWIQRMEDLFEPFHTELCLPYLDYYLLIDDGNEYVSDGDRFENQMKFAYVFYFDVELSNESIDIRFLQNIASFYYEYMEFERDLELALELKRQVKRIA